MKSFSPLEVKCGADKEPLEIIYQGQPLEVTSVLECWQDTGCWWAGESEKAFFRLILEDRIVREIFYDSAAEKWYIYKTYD